MSKLIGAIDKSNVLFTHHLFEDGKSEQKISISSKDVRTKTYIAVSKFSYPHYMYNIAEDSFGIIEDPGGAAGLTIINIPSGYYSGTTLASTLQSLLTTGSVGTLTYTVTFSAITGRLSFNAGGTLLEVDENTSGLFGVLGFDAAALPAAAATIETNYPINLLPTPYIGIHLTNINKSLFNGSRSQLAECVPLNADFGFTIFYEKDFSDVHFIPITKSANLEDDFNFTVNLRNARADDLADQTDKPWSLTLMFI